MKTNLLKATKWSLATELMAKLVVPITNLILARLLSPEAFGILATILMIISFSEMLSNAGFQKFLIQREFKDEREKQKSVDVAFWSNFILSSILWILIIINRDKLAAIVGNPGLGIPLAITSLVIPINSFSSIQIAIYRRNFNFKFLMVIRAIGIIVPLFVTIPLAYFGYSYWSLIIGMVMSQMIQGCALFLFTDNKIEFYYSFTILKTMLSFSWWSLLEAIAIWFTGWADTFIVGSYLNPYYVGLFKMPVAMINSAFSVITASIVPVLFSALSRSQNNQKEFNSVFFMFLRYTGLLLVPLGIGAYVYKEVLVNLFLGPKWTDASMVFGTWALSSVIVILFSHFCSEVYRAKGMPRLSFWSQVLHLVVLIPTIYYFVRQSFESFVYARSLIRLQGVFVDMIFMYYIIHINPLKMFAIIYRYMITAFCMGIFSYVLLKASNNIIWIAFSILISVVFYFVFLCLFKNERKLLYYFYENEIKPRFIF